MNRTDEQLVADHLAGDETALRFLVGRYLKPVYNLALRLTGDGDEAEDIAQDAFVKMWRHLGRYRPGRSFRAWLYTIVRRTTIDHWRRKRHVPFSDFENEDGGNFLEEGLTDPGPLPDESAMTAEEAAAATAAVKELPVIYRTVLYLRHDDELTFEEIGEVLDKPLNTVKSQYRRAVIRLRRILPRAGSDQDAAGTAPKDV